MMDPLPGEPETSIPPEGLVMNSHGDRLYGPGPIPKPPRRIVVSGSDLKPHLYQATEPHPNRDRAVLIGKALFIVILVWLLGVAFLSAFGHA